MIDLFTAVFEDAGNPRKPSASVSLSSGLTSTDALPIKGETRAVPLYSSAIPDDVDLAPFYTGARLLGLTRVGPQQLELARLILAEHPDDPGVPLFSEVVVEEPRRASKTTTLWACLLGLCALRPGYRVVTTAQTYIKARERFLEVYRLLAPRNVGEYVMKRGAAEMNIEWANGSRLWVVTPEGQAFRGDGADRILFDEAQEHGPEATADLLGGALALMDTKFDDDADLTDEDARGRGQVIVTGTTGKVREGMLWDFLVRGRRGDIGIIEYAVPDGQLVAFAVDTPEGRDALAAGWALSKDGKHVLNEPAIIRAHPGIGTLTTLGTIRARFGSMGLPQFAREYGGQWPIDGTSRAIDAEQWAAGRVDVYPPKPARYALAYDVAPDQSSAALAVAWRDEQGRAWVEVVEHQPGDMWLPRAVHAITRQVPGLLVGYDRIGPNRAVADRLSREARPRPKLVDLGTNDITAGAAQVSADLMAGTLFHRTDAGLDAAAEVATRRSIGDGSWAWGRRQGQRDGGDIAPLVAATNALRVYDTHLARTAHAPRPRIRTATRRPA